MTEFLAWSRVSFGIQDKNENARINKRLETFQSKDCQQSKLGGAMESGADTGSR